MLNTPRLTLRPWKDSDLPLFAEINADSKVCEFFPSTLSNKESDALAAKIQAHFNQHGFGLFALEEKNGAPFIGFVGLNIPSFTAHFTPCVEIGWRLGFPYWGKGYATEAAKIVLDYGFNELKLQEIVSFTAEKNLRSINVMEKLGMSRDKKGDFNHPALPDNHKLLRHVLYRITELRTEN